jgi:ubiquitin C-terminal hydrolase
MTCARVIPWDTMKMCLKNFSPHLPSYLNLGEQHDMAEMASWWLDVLHRELGRIGAPPAEGGNATSILNWMRGNSTMPTPTPTPLTKKAVKAWMQFHLRDNALQWEWTQLSEGLTVSQTQCLTCQKCFHNFEPFHCLSLEPMESLEKSFQSYFSTEKLYDWTCDDCKTKTPAERLVRFWKAPEVLAIQIKRFDGLRKIHTATSFPLKFKFLEDTELCRLQPIRTYDLMAVGNHYGSLHGGHYTATCRSFRSADDWIHIDDDQCTPVHTGEKWYENNAAAYMLYYVRRTAAN